MTEKTVRGKGLDAVLPLIEAVATDPRYDDTDMVLMAMAVNAAFVAILARHSDATSLRVLSAVGGVDAVVTLVGRIHQAIGQIAHAQGIYSDDDFVRVKPREMH